MSSERQQNFFRTKADGVPGWTSHRVWIVSLTALLSLDILFIGFHLLRAVLNDTSYQGFLLDRRWSLELDRTYPEYYQYLLAVLTAALLGRCYVLHRSLTYLSWSLAFVFIAVDDAFSLHEQFTGGFIMITGGVPLFGLVAEVYAASILWGLVGLGLVVLLVLGYSRDVASRRFSRQLGYVLLALFLCGGVLDALHLLADGADLGRAISFALGTLEDGGELVIVSVAFALTLRYWVALREKRASQDRVRLVREE